MSLYSHLAQMKIKGQFFTSPKFKTYYELRIFVLYLYPLLSFPLTPNSKFQTPKLF